MRASARASWTILCPFAFFNTIDTKSSKSEVLVGLEVILDRDSQANLLYTRGTEGKYCDERNGSE